MKINVKVIADYLTRNHSKFNASEMQAYSPLKLTEIGREFIKKRASISSSRSIKENS